MHGLRRPEVFASLVAKQEQADIGELQKLFVTYAAHMNDYLNFLVRQGVPQVEAVLEGIRRCKSLGPALDAFETSSRHYQQFGLSQLADSVASCRAHIANVLRTLERTVFADPELPAPPNAASPPEIGAVMRNLAELRELIAKGTPYRIASAMVEAKYPELVSLSGGAEERRDASPRA
jgi:hypothetical protein